MNKGRRKDHTWQFVKYKGDIAIYAKCSCGFHYGCCRNGSDDKLLSMEPNHERLYKYCPLCGSKKTRYINEVKQIDKYSWE